MPQLFTIPVALVIVVAGLAAGPAIADHRLLILYLGTVAAFAALMFAPARQGPGLKLAAATLTDAALVTAILLAAGLALPGIPLHLAASPPFVAVAFCVVLCALAALQFALARRAALRPVVVTLFAALFAAPVWLAPVVEASGNPPWLTNLAVAISPLSLLAVALDLDLLRTPWFYANSAIGSLRFSYPSLSACLLVPAITGSLLLAAASRHSHHSEVTTR